MAKALMIQGTMSNVGKSLITGGLCRIFQQDGYKVAPFKSQNMALNSFITDDGLEMGRAQVMQAECAKIKPDVRMNPILLKPVSDKGSQVIFMGEPLGNMMAADYFEYKKTLKAEVKRVYESLASDYDIVVIEGAGSPAEINLNKDDIVNMGMARMAKAPVILVGDIDRGGIFASLIGTQILLTEKEQDYLKGVIINKFRGDVNLLRSGVDMLEERMAKPVLGIVPHMDVDIDDEDSLSNRLTAEKECGLIDIAVIQFPKMSNFTDFNSLEAVEGISLRYVKTLQQLRNPDLIILPGTKNTMADLIWLRQNGLEAEILKRVSNGTAVFGICGGYQMLGKALYDPENVENGGELNGMGLIDAETVFKKEKIRTRVRGKFRQLEGVLKSLSGIEFEGYEIHMGVTKLAEASVPLSDLTAFIEQNLKQDGYNKGNVYGSYVHGIFDCKRVLEGIVEGISKVKGLEKGAIQIKDVMAYKDEQYDILAEGLRKSLDIKRIYDIVERGIE